jgi:hypothetical protein
VEKRRKGSGEIREEHTKSRYEKQEVGHLYGDKE